MRLLRRNNSLLASKLPRALRSAALRSHESKVHTLPPASDSPETLTKRGKISRVSERSIHNPRVSSAEHDEREEGEAFVVSRRLTRAMDGEEPSKFMTMDAPRSMRFKDFDGEKPQNKDMGAKLKNKALKKAKKAGLESRVLPASLPADHRETENTSYRKKLRYQDQNSTENGDDNHQGMAADDPRILENGNYRLTRLDMTKNKVLSIYGNASDSLNKLGEVVRVPLNQDLKKLSQARAVLKSLQRQQKVPSTVGVTTRHKASSTTQAQPLRRIDGESESPQSPKSTHSEKNIEEGDLHDSPALGNAHSAKSQTSRELQAEARKKKGPWLHAGWPHRNGAIVNTSLLNNGRVLTRTGKAQQERASHRREEGKRFTREKGKSEGGALKISHLGDTQSAYTALDLARSPKRKLKKPGKGEGNGSSLLQHWKKRRTVNRSGDSEQINTNNEACLQPITSPCKASEEGLRVTARNLKDSVTTPRRSKRKRNTARLEVLNDHEATPKMHSSLSKNTKPLGNLLQVRGQTEDVAVRDTFSLKGTSSNIEHLLGNDGAMEKELSTLKAAENKMGPNLDVFKIDPLSKCCLVATNPTETGGRKMRPRPLDLEQPLLVLVEGSNQDYYEFDGGSFYRMLQQQPESQNPSISKVKSNRSNRTTVDVLDATGEKAEPILIPSFRSRIESEDGMQNLGIPYVLPDSYIKTRSETKSLQAEYDMDDEDEEWLNNYNQSVSPASTLSAEQFEKIIDLLENKAADANGYNPITEAFEEDQELASEECCICNGGENSENNLVYQCSSCHILVHQSCYGIQKGGRNVKRKRNWNCRKCEAVAEGKVTAELSCSLCCKQGGALKPTTELHRWAHVVCALYTNETYFVNPDAMEPIDGLDAADARAKRQRRKCWLCDIREGSVERCSVPGCKAVFHVSCGVTQGASFELQHSNHQVISVRVYCPKHALSALGAAKAKTEEGEKENQIEKQGEENQNLKLKTSVDHEELFPAAQEISIQDHWPRKRRKRKSLSKERASGQGASDHHGKEYARILEHGCTFISCREQECTGRSFKGEKTSELAKKGRAVNGLSGAKAGATLISDDMLGIGNANPGLMEGVYFYWFSKRARQGGALLHHIQQEHAARQFNIFNSDDDVGPATIPVSEGSFPRHSVIDMKVVAARQQLQRLQELTLLVVRRERLKLDIFLLEQNILNFGLAALNATSTSRRRCLFCKETNFSLVCSVCNSSTCLHCLMSRSRSRYKSWLDYLKLPKYVCLECDNQVHRESACSPLVHWEDDCLASSCIIRAWKKVFGRDKMLESSLISSYKRPLILLPRSDFIHQDKLAIEVLWEQSPRKTALISDLIKNPL